MSTLLQLGIDNDLITSTSKHHSKVNNAKNVLRSRENIVKSKCRKSQRKYIKYKLRKDGQEDTEILNVSQSLQTSLKIKSPNNSNVEQIHKPKNYLLKMVRNKDKTNRIDEKGDNSSLSQTYPVITCDDDDTQPVPLSQDRKQTNAFKLMMDSRNKSIGSNSPGKEMQYDESGSKDIIEKRILKTKRNLILQKMAESKGSLKKKEIDENHEKCIKMKLESRAEKLKNMITNTETKKSKKKKNKKVKKTISSPISNTELQEIYLEKYKHDLVDTDKNEVNGNQKSLQLVDIFEESINLQSKIKKTKSRTNNKKLSEEDEEFVCKLSPSIRKRENMMSYFHKVEKTSVRLENENEDHKSVKSNHIIKVKLSSRNKKHLKKSSLCLKKNVLSESSKTCELTNIKSDNTDSHILTTTIQKPSIVGPNKSPNSKDKDESINLKEISSNNQISDQLDGVRARRNVKRPINYIDDIQSFSSDDELNILSPKRKKHVKQFQAIKVDTLGTYNGKVIIDSSLQTKMVTQKKKDKKSLQQKQNVKLAPIFSAKPLTDTAISEAKQKFLQSGIPDKLKKVIAHQNISNQLSLEFPVVVHVQQTLTVLDETNVDIPYINTNLSSLQNDETCLESTADFFNSIQSFSLTQQSNSSNCKKNILPKTNIQQLLKNMKQSYPKFPVYRTYNLLKARSKGEFMDCNYHSLDNSLEVINNMTDMKNYNPDILKWTDKYKAMSSKQIIGNFENIKELRKWLVSWTEKEAAIKNLKSDTDSSDFYQSDSDSRQNINNSNNLMVLSGPVGSGKTSCVYAVATELAIKVIEVNASSKRNGKIMLQDLQEATQSHKVDRGKSSSTENSQKSQDVINFDLKRKNKKRGRPKKTEEPLLKKGKSFDKSDCLSQLIASQENVRTGMSLILIDDADIVFDQDDGFISAISQLIQSSKRPVILVTGSLNCPHLQRFIQCGKVISMNSLLPRMLGTWLDIMCLADNSFCFPGLGSKVLDFYRGDIRKAINSLQFYMFNNMQDEKPTSQNCDELKVINDNENSSMSWTEYDCSEESNIVPTDVTSLENSVWRNFMEKEIYETNSVHFNIWWSLPNILYDQLNSQADITEKDSGISTTGDQIITELEAIANVVDGISISDYFGRINPCSRSNITCSPWYSEEADSVSENENLYNFSLNQKTSKEISHYIITRNLTLAKAIKQCDNGNNISLPNMKHHREKDRIVSRHHSLTNSLNPGTMLDRRSLALDYWPSCREICRIEKNKTDKSNKRNNRFYHYLKSIKVMSSNETFDKLCDSLCSSNESEITIT